MMVGKKPMPGSSNYGLMYVSIVLQLILTINFLYYVRFCLISPAGSAPAQAPYELHGNYNDATPPFTIPGRLAGEITFSQIAMRFVF